MNEWPSPIIWSWFLLEKDVESQFFIKDGVGTVQTDWPFSLLADGRIGKGLGIPLDRTIGAHLSQTIYTPLQIFYRHCSTVCNWSKCSPRKRFKNIKEGKLPKYCMWGLYKYEKQKCWNLVVNIPIHYTTNMKPI